MSRALVLTALVLLVPGATSATPPLCPAGAPLGTVAYARKGHLHVVNLATCSDRVVAGRATEAMFNADGSIVAIGGNRVVTLAGQPFYGRWARGTWAPRGRRMASVTPGGGVLVGGPGLQARKPVKDGFGATSVAWWGDQLAVGRLPASLWIVGLDGQRGQEAGAFLDQQAPEVFTVFGGWIAWWAAPGNSQSLRADGLPVLFKRIAAGIGPRSARGAPLMLPGPDAWASCGRRLIVSLGGDRYATHGKALIVWQSSARGPTVSQTRLSRDASRSWISPACSSRTSWVAASAGRNFVEPRFGDEHRAIWILSRDGKAKRQLTHPPANYSDEAPRWSADGRSIFFVRTRADGRGTLYAVTIEGRLSGPIADLGRAANYYGRYAWHDRFDVAR